MLKRLCTRLTDTEPLKDRYSQIPSQDIRHCLPHAAGEIPSAGIKLFFRRSANRANARAGAAGDAGIRVDHILAFTFADCGNGTFLCAGTARHALIADYICHENYLHTFNALGCVSQCRRLARIRCLQPGNTPSLYSISAKNATTNSGTTGGAGKDGRDEMPVNRKSRPHSCADVMSLPDGAPVR